MGTAKAKGQHANWDIINTWSFPGGIATSYNADEAICFWLRQCALHSGVVRDPCGAKILWPPLSNFGESANLCPTSPGVGALFCSHCQLSSQAWHRLKAGAPSDEDDVRIEERHGVARTAVGVASDDHLQASSLCR